MSISSKSDGARIGKHAITIGCILSPNPTTTNMIMIKDTPHIVLSRTCLSPIPCFFNFKIRTIHVLHVVTICKCGEFSMITICGFTHVITCSVTVNFKSSDWVGHSENTSSPSFIVRLIRVVIGGVIRIVVVVRTMK